MNVLLTWWRGRGAGARGALVVAAVLVAVYAVTSAGDLLFGHDPGGPGSSSYATGDDGLAAAADLVGSVGHPVERLRSSLRGSALDPGSTLVLADPDVLLGADIDVVREFLDAGGRLVASGRSTRGLLRELADPELQWRPEGETTVEMRTAVPESGGARRLRGSGAGTWRTSGALRPLAGSDDAPFALVGNVGAGRVVAFADSSPLQNAYLGRDDDAAVLLGAVGPAPRPVVFDEHSHGYGGAGGSIPAPWWRASWVALAAVVMLMWSVARRLGPAEEVARALPPPRREYVDALAVSLARSREPAVAMAGLQRRARARLSARLGLTEQAGRDELKAAAARAGLSLADDIDVLFDAPGRDAEVLAIARVAARQEGVR